uniref:non-specific serine/threonine protein kinase n=1 Tax=Anthurium amnicola TaxID=1678845 RepID=A0A1D1YS23_9ARAE
MDQINKEILQEVIKMGFDVNHLFEALHNRIQNEATVAYYLLLDNQSCASNGYLGADFQETMEYGIASMISPAASMMAHQRQYIDQQEMGLGSHFPVKWDLGLKSWADPCEIMAEVLKVLQELNVFWKQIGHYGLKCRWFPGFTNHPESLVNEHLPADLSFGHNSAILNEEYDVVMSPNTVKFEVQLYKTESEKYLLDLQRVKGPQLLFLDLCAAFRAQLRVL